MNRLASQTLIVLCLLRCAASLLIINHDSVRAQDLDNSSISGRVMDQLGAVIPGAELSVMLTNTGAARNVNSDAQGRYRLIQLPPGNYNLRVVSKGFAPLEKNDVRLLAGQSMQLDLRLVPANLVVDPVIIAAGDVAELDITRTVVGGTLTASEIETLPVPSRLPLDLIFLVPGVSEEPLSTRELAEDRNITYASTPEETGTFSLSGAPAYSNNLTIDGLDNNDDRAARERFQPPLDAIEEVQVISNQFSAEYGRASGGRINLRTRSGSSALHGRMFYFFRDESLNANSFRNNSIGVSRLPLQEHNPGGSLGGPVPYLTTGKSRTFFFVALEHNKVLDTALIDTLVPVEQNPLFPLPAATHPSARRLEDVAEPALAAEIAPYISSLSTPMRNASLSARLDHHFNQRHQGNVLYQRGRSNNLRQFGGGNRLAQALQGKTRNSDAISYADNFLFSPTLISQARIQYSQFSPALKASGGNRPVVLIAFKDSTGEDGSTTRSGTLVAGSSTAGATDRQEQRLQLQEIMASVLHDHSLKFGFDLHRIHSTLIDLSDVSGTYNFASAGDFLADIPNRFRQNFHTASTQRNTYLGLFFHDEWRPRSNLFLSYGLRYERETIIRDWNNFGPRFSVAFDPFNSGKTVLRAGLGAFYNRVLLRTVDDFTIGGRQILFDTNALRDPVTGMLLSADQRRAFTSSNFHFPDTLAADSALVEEFGMLNNRFSRRLDPALRIPESYQANIGLERHLGRSFVIEANFTVNRGLHLWREFNVNAPVLPAGYKSFSEYLGSRDFPNFRSPANGIRPLYNATGAGTLVRFVFNPGNPANPNSVVNIVEFGVPISLVNLNSFSSATSLEIARAAVNNFRPDPTAAEIEQLISAGNSFYEGLTIELRRRYQTVEAGFGLSFRAAYTFSHLTDDGIVNTSDALTPGDFRAERARSLLDRRHRFLFSAILDLTRYLGKLRLGSIWRVTSGAPFNISIGGADRNLDDVGNDRPGFNGDSHLLNWRSPGEAIDQTLISLFRLPTIGSSGNLPRNAGQGPGQFLLDLNIGRDFSFTSKVKLRPLIEFDNVLNKTVFSFGSEFINFSAVSPSASVEQRRAFLDTFLVTGRTMRPRQIRVGVRLEF